MARIHLPAALRPYASGQRHITLRGQTIGELLAALTQAQPGLQNYLFTEHGELRQFVNVFVNQEDIRTRDGLQTPICDSDEISIVPSVAGGSTAPEINLTREEYQRYSRHLVLPEVGVAGQKRLKASSALIIGAGGLGSPLAMYLAASGIGRLGLVDFDVVEASNLQRQIIHKTVNIGMPKLKSAQENIAEINPNVQVEAYEAAFDSSNALEIAADYDVIIDGTDNFPTRYLVNDVCVLLDKPNVYGSVFRFEGQASVFWAARGPCYRCLYPQPPPPGLVPSCAEGGVLGILPGIIGLVQATETVKLLLGIGETLVGRLLLYDALELRFRELRLRKNPDCPICGEHRTIHALIDYHEFCGVPHPGTEQNRGEGGEITAAALRAKLESGRVFLLDVREPQEWQICHIEGAVLIPLNELHERLSEIDGSREIVVYCHVGSRSARAVELLRQAGYTSAKNLLGGIRAWAETVDPGMPRY